MTAEVLEVERPQQLGDLAATGVGDVVVGRHAGAASSGAYFAGSCDASSTHCGDELSAPIRLEDLSPDDYSAVFMPGGHGPMEDLAISPELGGATRRDGRRQEH